MKRIELEFSSPSRGSYISTFLRNTVEKVVESVLVPFPGFLYLYQKAIDELEYNPSSRPLPGVLISLQKEVESLLTAHCVLVPFPGFLYLYTCCEN